METLKFTLLDRNKRNDNDKSTKRKATENA